MYSLHLFALSSTAKLRDSLRFPLKHTPHTFMIFYEQLNWCALEEFDWIAQLRYYWRQKGSITLKVWTTRSR